MRCHPAALILLLALALLLPRQRWLSDQRADCQFDLVAAAGLSPDRFAAELMLRDRPALITGALGDWDTERFSWKALTRRLGGQAFRVGAGPYPTDEELLRDFADSAAVPGIFQFGQVPSSFTLDGSSAGCRPEYSLVFPYSAKLHDNASVACTPVCLHV